MQLVNSYLCDMMLKQLETLNEIMLTDEKVYHFMPNHLEGLHKPLSDLNLGYLTLLHLQIAYALVCLYLHSRHWKYPVYLHSQEEKHRNANTIIEIVVTQKVYILQISHDVRQDSTLLTNVDQCV